MRIFGFLFLFCIRFLAWFVIAFSPAENWIPNVEEKFLSIIPDLWAMNIPVFVFGVLIFPSFGARWAHLISILAAAVVCLSVSVCAYLLSFSGRFDY